MSESRSLPLRRAGDLDTEFAEQGRLALPYFADIDRQVGRVCLGTDDTVVICARAHDKLIPKYGLCRYDIDGAPTPSFGGGTGFIVGQYPGDIGAQGESVLTHAYRGEEKIFMAGAAFSSNVDPTTPVTLWISCFNANGELDSDFGESGHRALSVEGFAYHLNSARMVIRNGWLYISSNFNCLSDTTIAAHVYRLDLRGQLDSSFNGCGYVPIRHGDRATRVNALAVQAQGDIVVAGSTDAPQGEAGLFAHLREDGTLDTDFGNQGYATFQGIGLHTELHGLVVADGQPIGIGFTQSQSTAGDNLGLIYRLTSTGQPDLAFNQGNPVLTSLGIGATGGQWLTGMIDDDGWLVTVGDAANRFTFKSLVLGRYSLDGVADEHFGTSGLSYVDGEEFNVGPTYSLIQQVASRRLLVGLNYLGVGGLNGYVIGVHSR